MKVTVTIPAVRGHLSFLRGIVSQLGLSPALKRRCSLALVEAVDNAIIHSEKRSAVVEIEIEVRRSGISMVVRDEGKGFDIKDIKEPSLLDVSGRGVHIIKSLSDRVSYRDNKLSLFFKERRS